ncbi:VQ motif-containing protein 20 [Cryptomeria japonica]|uniref:VQ motif-containing protein 20 n=1 Tax=Cryptomeria japonica TaxID=3369 RepID=UPI0027D9EBE8|nr:VQ motif-containing protein 20 [Cryptomeria japonica]
MTQFFGDFNRAKASSLYDDSNSGGNFIALKMHKDSQKIKKPPVSPSPSPSVPYRKPVIIHTYSPKVIQAEAHNFMQLVQKLTGWDAAEKKRKRKNKNKTTAGGDSEILTSSLNNSISSMSVKPASANTLLNDNRSFSNNQLVPSFRHNCFEEKVNNLSISTPADFMADNSYASSQSALSSMDLCQVHLFNNVPNILSSSQNFRIPWKQQQQPPPPPQPSNYIADGIYMNPCQENPSFLENLPPSSSPAIGEYNFSEFLPPVFPKNFDF